MCSSLRCGKKKGAESKWKIQVATLPPFPGIITIILPPKMSKTGMPVEVVQAKNKIAVICKHLTSNMNKHTQVNFLF